MVRSLAVFSLATSLIACGSGAPAGSLGPPVSVDAGVDAATTADVRPHSDARDNFGDHVNLLDLHLPDIQLPIDRILTMAPDLAPLKPPPPPPSPPSGPYPIVLVHGFSGWNQIGPIAYFYGVADALRADGETVFVTQADPYQAISVRAGQVNDQITGFLDQTGSGKVNIIAHSQGGLDSRYTISTLGLAAKVASLTTIAAPHQGTYVADVIVNDVPGFADTAVAALVDLLGQAAAGRKQDMLMAMSDMSTAAVAAFNSANPDDPDVSYYSYGGQACVVCLHPVTPLLFPTYEILEFQDGANDGLVTVESAHWGDYLGTLPTDHMGEIGQLVGLTTFDQISFYRSVVQGLRSSGF